MDQLEAGSFLSPTSGSVRPCVIRIVSWNISRGQQLDGVIEFLDRMAADLILLQEADVNARRTKYHNTAREIAQALRMDYVFGCEFEELTQGDHDSPAYHGQATLSRLPISASRILRFHRQSDFWRPRWFVPKIGLFQRRLGARMALVSHISCFEKQLVVYNVHLESRSNDELRCRQLSEILGDVHQHHSDMPVVIAGDFNLDLSREPVASIIENVGFNNSFKNGKIRTTRTWSPLGRGRAIDWILVRGRLNCAAAELHDSVRASDHYPLSVHC